MNMKILLFGILLLMSISLVSATNSGHLCDGVSDDGLHVVDVLWNPMVDVVREVNGVNYTFHEYNGSAVRVSHNGGQSFSVYQLGRPDSAYYFNGVVISNDGTKILAWDNQESRHVMYYSVNGGLNWTKYDKAIRLSTACISGDYAVASGDTVISSNNGMQSWNDRSIYTYRSYGYGPSGSFGHYAQVDSPMIPIGGANLVMSDDGLHVVVARYGDSPFAGHMWWSSTGGQTFHNVPINYHNGNTTLFTQAHWNGLVMSCDGQHVIASNEGYTYYQSGKFWENGDVLVSDNYGVDWHLSGIGNAGNTVFSISGMDCAGNVEVWQHDAAAGTYVKFSSTDYGASWTSSNNVPYNPTFGGNKLAGLVVKDIETPTKSTSIISDTWKQYEQWSADHIITNIIILFVIFIIGFFIIESYRMKHKRV